jgi:hypothetical protein
VEFPQLRAEHPILTATAVRMLGMLWDWSAQVQPAAGNSVWMHHIDFTERTEAHAIVIAVAEARTWSTYIGRRPQLTPLDQSVTQQLTA